MIRVRLLQALMVDGRDRAMGEVVEIDDATGADFVRQGLAAPAPAVVERAVVEPGRTADGPAQAKRSKRSPRPGGS